VSMSGSLLKKKRGWLGKRASPPGKPQNLGSSFLQKKGEIPIPSVKTQVPEQEEKKKRHTERTWWGKVKEFYRTIENGPRVKDKVMVEINAQEENVKEKKNWNMACGSQEGSIGENNDEGD